MNPHLPLAAAALAAALLTAPPALAADATHDDTSYPGVPATFVATARTGEIETPDVTYRGAHAAIVKGVAPRTDGPIAASDDVSYPSADAPAQVAAAAPAAPVAPERTDGRLACGCLHG